jgi:hydrogenase maturation factor
VCVTRVGKVLSVARGTAAVRFFDGRENSEVDVSVLKDVENGSFVEVYGNLALSILRKAEAKKRLEAWEEVRRAAMLPPVRHGKSP